MTFIWNNNTYLRFIILLFCTPSSILWSTPTTVVVLVTALERCSERTGGGFCPSQNTCCPLASGDTTSSSARGITWIRRNQTSAAFATTTGGGSGCIPADLGAYNATCCADGRTGCGVDYVCSPDGKGCLAKAYNTDPLVQRLDRYRLCQAPPGTLQRIYGFGRGGGNDNIKAAYYSNLGDLELLAETSSLSGVRKPNRIRLVIFVIHGAGRNADDYYCSMYSAVQQHQRKHQSANNLSEVLVVAPRFAAEADPSFSLFNGGIPMRWNDGDWRYGAESIEGSNVSSFQALDEMVKFLTRAGNFPYLEDIKVIGHSAGGQFAQRWALTTSSWTTTKTTQPWLQAIAVNPSSFAYLTPLRKSSMSQKWILPNVSDCPQYNEWEWGLETTDASPLYVRKVLNKWSVKDLTVRFANRDVVYLAGERDVCNVPGMSKDGWCYSHGLETLCSDMAEGKNRLERHMNYFESLVGLVNVTTHRRDIVPNVGHDHSLIFHSQVTQKYLFEQHHWENDVGSKVTKQYPSLK